MSGEECGGGGERIGGGGGDRGSGNGGGSEGVGGHSNIAFIRLRTGKYLLHNVHAQH